MFSDHRVAVVIPARDEQRLLPRVLAGLPAWVDDVVVVDDGSTDGTAAIAQRWGPPVRVVRLPVNRGVGAAIATGYRVALEGGADVVAVMAADDQMRPDELWRLVGPVVRGECGYCKGERLGHPEVGRRMPRARRLGVVGLSWLTRRVAGLPALADAQCGFTAASAAALRAIPLERLYPRYGYPNDLLVMLAAAGVTIAERTVTPVYADESSGLRPALALLTHSFVLARAAWWRWAGGAPGARRADAADPVSESAPDPRRSAGQRA